MPCSILKSTDYFEKICQKLRGIGKSKKNFLEVIIMKRRIALLLASAMLLTSAVAGLTACGDEEGGSNGKKGHVYYLNFKPEVDKQWQELAAKYTEETGVQVDVVTAADNQYEQKLLTEIGKEDAPTLFQIKGASGLATWDEYCYDLTDSDIVKELSTDTFALKNGALHARMSLASLLSPPPLLAKAGEFPTTFPTFRSIMNSRLTSSAPPILPHLSREPILISTDR